jgi:hypothetical protein
MGDVRVKLDSKVEFAVPAEIREQIGDAVILKKTPEGYLLVPFLCDSHRVVTSKPGRTGKTEFLSPEKMNSIWEPKV